ncbi:MAG: DNA polymerase III subunit delta [Myxococcales bacterium]|nr:DNA polymerase III subunit delta [Myxococcales bacterium]
MTPDAAIAAAKRGELLPVYGVVGEERWFRERVIRALREAALGGGLADFNEDKLTAGDATVDRVLSAVRTVPMMAPRRFVIVRQVDRWEEKDAADDAGFPTDPLAEYAKAPVPSTCLVLVADKLDGRRKLASTLKKGGVVVECAKIERRALPARIADVAKAKGHDIAIDTCELLGELVGSDLSTLDDAVERLSLYVGPGARIDDDAVAECIHRVRADDSWALVDAIGQRNLARALAVLADAYEPRDRGLPLLGAIAWSVRQLARFQAALESGDREDEAARKAGVFQPFRARELAQKAKAIKPREVERWLVVLGETDLALKGSRRPPDAILEDMLMSLCKPAGRARA